MIKLFFLLIICIINVTPHYSQGENHSSSPKQLNHQVDEWVFGKVVFVNGSKTECEFSYNPLVPEGLLKVRQGPKINTYSAFNVDYFSYHDEDGTEHKYVSLPVTGRNKIFIELIYEDPTFTFLGRKSIQINKHSQYGYTSSSIRNTYERYVHVNSSKNFISLFPYTLSDIMKDKKKEIKRFIKANKIKFKTNNEYILVFKEYQELKKNTN